MKRGETVAAETSADDNLLSPQKSLSTRTHVCPQCNYVEDRDVNAAINILQKGLSTVGHTGAYKLGEFDPLAPLEQSCGVTIGL